MIQRIAIPRVLVAVVVLSFLAVSPATAQWNWQVTPYLWASDIRMDLTTPIVEGGGDVDFSDLIDKVDGAFQVHAEGRKTKGGIFFDFTYISISDTVVTTGNGTLPLPPDTTATTGVKLVMTEGGGVYKIAGSEDSFLDLIYGARYISLDPTIELTLPILPAPTTQVGESSSYLDALLGLRFYSKLGTKWDLMARFDYAFGDTEGALNLLAGIGYRFGKRDQLALRVAYRHMELEVVEAPATIDLTMSGPLLGFEIGF